MPPRIPRALVLALALASLLLPVAAVAQSDRPDPIGQDPIIAGHTYRGDFPDPTVLRVKKHYFAYSTSSYNLNMPVLVSANSHKWRATARRDALPAVPKWAYHRSGTLGTVWAPSVVHWRHHYLAAYAVRKRGATVKMCISIAVSKSPRGPFVDHTKRPLVCPHNRGAIDPMLYREHGHKYILYKTEDISIGKPTRIWIRRLTKSGRHKSKAKQRLLLTANQAWENRTVEGPAMIRYQGRRYLFYSAGGWGSPNYAISYAVCKSVYGPCARRSLAATTPGGKVTHPPFFTTRTSGGRLVAPGGGTPFVDKKHRLRLAYHAWDAGATHYPTSTKCKARHRCGQRRLHVAVLGVAAGGSLVVRRLG